MSNQNLLFAINEYALTNTPFNLSLKNINLIDFLNLTLPKSKFNNNKCIKHKAIKKKNEFKHCLFSNCYFTTEFIQLYKQNFNKNGLFYSFYNNNNNKNLLMIYFSNF